MYRVKLKYYRYGKTLVIAYKKAGRLGAYSLSPKAQQFQADPQMLSTIDFDRSGLAQRISRIEFKQIARERGVQELPLELQSAKTTNSRAKKTVLPVAPTN